ncbi:hypothetical protein [Niveispirillum cyanobacteriorum]|uniref:Uncharacterized protein n=1 Tax=Niveispirillum cyanobacteriorum TaxID=1612173 RepID=A0A2K9NCB9_9PROT|nr:hypothetical protein [Niveispirillum cyanobacteriorum]AUN30729.1 hypothetical protein C0V82_11110 [Niveispirillum cyanobacteriorum]GGE51853.1 hypothetical protein GCM10011317_07710 [Niveispirillum cyanobacteriorum]
MDAVTPESFAALVKHYFQFLIDAGFEETGCQRFSVSFCKAEVTVFIFRETRSYEIDAVIALPGGQFGIEDVIRHNGPPNGEPYRAYAALTEPAIANGLERLAKLLKTHGAPALEGDKLCFDRMAQLRDEASAAYALNALLSHVRPKAEIAFKVRDYAKAAKLYRQIRQHLSPAEVKKLAYAEAHLGTMT